MMAVQVNSGNAPQLERRFSIDLSDPDVYGRYLVRSAIVDVVELMTFREFWDKYEKLHEATIESVWFECRLKNQANAESD